MFYGAYKLTGVANVVAKVATAESATPFDMFTMAPRNRGEFLQAIGYQADRIEKSNGGFGVPHGYLTEAVGFMGPVKCLELLYQAAPPDRFKVFYDGRVDAFLIETYPQPKPAKKSVLIMPGHA